MSVTAAALLSPIGHPDDKPTSVGRLRVGGIVGRDFARLGGGDGEDVSSHLQSGGSGRTSSCDEDEEEDDARSNGIEAGSGRKIVDKGKGDAGGSHYPLQDNVPMYGDSVADSLQQPQHHLPVAAKSSLTAHPQFLAQTQMPPGQQSTQKPLPNTGPPPNAYWQNPQGMGELQLSPVPDGWVPSVASVPVQGTGRSPNMSHLLTMERPDQGAWMNLLQQQQQQLQHHHQQHMQASRVHQQGGMYCPPSVSGQAVPLSRGQGQPFMGALSTHPEDTAHHNLHGGGLHGPHKSHGHTVGETTPLQHPTPMALPGRLGSFSGILQGGPIELPPPHDQRQLQDPQQLQAQLTQQLQMQQPQMQQHTANPQLLQYQQRQQQEGGPSGKRGMSMPMRMMPPAQPSPWGDVNRLGAAAAEAPCSAAAAAHRQAQEEDAALLMLDDNAAAGSFEGLMSGILTGSGSDGSMGECEHAV